MPLREQIEALAASEKREYTNDDLAVFAEFKAALNRGEIRAAEKNEDGNWKTNAWVKSGILLGFRMGLMAEMSKPDDALQFIDKHTYPIRKFSIADGVRIVPGGSSIRDGAYIAPGVVCMPPMFVNVGAYVDEGSMIDSHALVGSCAQVGKRVHLSAAAQIGGVLEPVGAAPVYDLAREKIYQRTPDAPLEIPAGAVVVPGSRNVRGEVGKAWGLSVYAPIIVKYRDEKTERSVQLEDYLR
jgi:2,3,4,5-tetrahydropyridine-2,6-dicarboxylate N-succinyltransferase